MPWISEVTAVRRLGKELAVPLKCEVRSLLENSGQLYLIIIHASIFVKDIAMKLLLYVQNLLLLQLQ